MKIKCNNCSNIQEITLDAIIFDGEAEEAFVTYLAIELPKSENDKGK